MKQEETTERLNDGSHLISRPLEEVLPLSMMPYAEHVILDRALPRVEDGLKPVQRRILYTMYELGMTPDKPYRKSARIVGDCLGKYHPHGDSSVYDAMVRMAQSFNMRMPLVDGQGNYGSVDGDGAAAMRYTEARLQPLALELLRDIEKNTVRWSRNFDDHLKEPDMLPGRFPNLLVNGASGIAVGLATSIPPHNLGEVIDGVVAYIDNKNIKLKDMLKIIKGPDFPTGGYVSGSEEIEQAYATGKSKLTVRAKIHVETLPSEKKNIVITELPYQVNKAALLKSILDLREEKKDLLAGISEIVDESDKEGMRAVIRIKKDCDPNAILKVLYKHTNLQTTFGVNMVAIANGKPKQLSLMEIIAFYTDYQRDVILRRTKYELDEARAKEHILQGLLIAVQNIDEVVDIIKKSASTSEARMNLRNRFSLSEKQAQAILDLRLARLTKLEVTKLEEELRELEKLIANLTAIIGSKQLQNELMKSELNQIKRQYKSPRRSQIVTKIEDAKVHVQSDKPETETFVIAISADGCLKRIPAKNYSMSTKEVTERTAAYDMITSAVETETGATIFCFSNLGNCFKVEATAIPECRYHDKGADPHTYLSDLAPNERLLTIRPVFESVGKEDLLFYTKAGMIKRSNWAEYGLLKNYFQAVKLKEGDEVISVEDRKPNYSVLFVTQKGMCLNFDQSDVPLQGRVSGGVKGMLLAEDDEVVFARQVSDEGEVIVVTDRGYMKRVILAELDVMARYRKGVKIVDLDGNGKTVAFADCVTMPYNLAFVTEEGLRIVNTEDIVIETRLSKGRAPKGCRKGLALQNVVHYRTDIEYAWKMSDETEPKTKKKR